MVHNFITFITQKISPKFITSISGPEELIFNNPEIILPKIIQLPQLPIIWNQNVLIRGNFFGENRHRFSWRACMVCMSWITWTCHIMALWEMWFNLYINYKWISQKYEKIYYERLGDFSFHLLLCLLWAQNWDRITIKSLT